MKTFLLLLTAVPCWSFQQYPVFSVRRRRQDAAFISKAAATLEEPPTTSSELPPVLQDIVDERAEFQRNLGKAMDTLRKDYPEILHKAPDYSIYSDDITVTDPSGVQLAGLKSYKNAIQFVQTLISFLYASPKTTTTGSKIQFRLCYDFCRSCIRVSWHLELYPKFFPTPNRPMHVDGISTYTLSRSSGKILEHKVENLYINNNPIVPPYGIFGMVREEASVGVAVGAGMC